MNSGIQAALKPESGHNFNDSNRVALENAMSMNTAKAKLQAVEKDLTAQEKQRADQQIEMIRMQQQETQEVANRITKLKEEKEAILDIAATESLTASGQKIYSSGSKEMDSLVSSAR
jgi:DNA anti-recombination protein RmuC